MWFFPEGTRRNTGVIHPFKKGAFYVAINSQLPVLPVVFSSYYFLCKEEKRLDSGMPSNVIKRLSHKLFKFFSISFLSLLILSYLHFRWRSIFLCSFYFMIIDIARFVFRYFYRHKLFEFLITIQHLSDCQINIFLDCFKFTCLNLNLIHFS